MIDGTALQDRAIDDGFVVVFGSLRAGTTLLRLMLDQHPELICPGEADFVFDHLKFGPDGRTRLDTEALDEDWIREATGVTARDTLLPEEAVNDMIAQLGRPGTVTMLMLHRGLDKVLRLFPRTRVIHLVRDPRDVASSSIGLGWAGTPFHGTGTWLRTELEWEATEQRIPADQKMHVRYEDLILQPKTELERICGFIGKPFLPGMLDYPRRSTYSAPDPSLTEQWKRKMSPRDIALVEGRVGDLLSARGYSASGIPPAQPHALEAAGLAIRNKYGIWRSRMSRFGLVDPVVVRLAHRTGFAGLARSAQRRMTEKNKAFLK